MSVECGHCERDLRGGHDKGCQYRNTPKSKVLKRHASAWAHPWKGSWAIYDGNDGRTYPFAGQGILGEGKTARQAWADAERNTNPMKRPMKSTSSAIRRGDG